MVDFGCGRGRVSFYLHNKFHIPVTGVEVNDLTFDEALANRDRYYLIGKHIEAPIRFEYGHAEDYDIEPDDNVFYFFNPFSVQIYKKVIKNIINSLKKTNRPVDIILYYPMPEFKQFMKNHTSFRLINKIKVPGLKDRKEKFLIYRHEVYDED